jgi:hypothetical protein
MASVTDAVSPVVEAGPDGIPTSSVKVVAPSRILSDQNPAPSSFDLFGQTFPRAVTIPRHVNVALPGSTSASSSLRTPLRKHVNAESGEQFTTGSFFSFANCFFIVSN